MNGQRIDETAANVGGNVANLATDLISLTELQAKLAILDLQETTAQAVTPAAVLVGGACLVLGTIPVALLGFSGLLAKGAGISLEAAMLLISLLALAAAGLCVWFGYSRILTAMRVLDRSRQEFQANLQWIKKAIQHSSTTKTRSYR